MRRLHALHALFDALKKGSNMGKPSQVIDESPVADADTDTPTAEASQAQIDAAVAKAVAAFAAAHGITPPQEQATALQALQRLEQLPFAEKVKTLVENGIGEAELVSETPVVRTLAAIVGELAEKIG